MPIFSFVISIISSPRKSSWSYEIGVMIAKSLFGKIFVASNCPPIPTSKRFQSALCLLNKYIAQQVINSKKAIFLSFEC